MHPALRALLRLLAIGWLVLLLATLLAACGGGGDDPPAEDAPPASTQPVDCKTNPEACK